VDVIDLPFARSLAEKLVGRAVSWCRGYCLFSSVCVLRVHSALLGLCNGARVPPLVLAEPLLGEALSCVGFPFATLETSMFSGCVTHGSCCSVSFDGKTFLSDTRMLPGTVVRAGALEPCRTADAILWDCGFIVPFAHRAPRSRMCAVIWWASCSRPSLKRCFKIVARTARWLRTHLLNCRRV
jgi:hypothetical protein